MKYLLVLFGLIAISSGISPKVKEQIANLAKECRLSSGVEPKVLKRLQDGQVEDDPKLKSFFFCIYKLLKFQRADGTIDAETFKSNFPAGIPDNEKDAIFNDCLKLKGVDGGDTAFLLYKCSISKLTDPHYNLLV